MKKNTMMRVASALLVAVLMTTCAISGTFAKYITSDDAQASARVAKWGVGVSVTADGAFSKNQADVTGDNGVQVKADTEVVAPGTSGELVAIEIEGTPEVVVDVVVNTAELTLSGWTIDSGVYCPIVFTVGSEEIKMDNTITTLAALEEAVEAKVKALAKTNVQVGTDLADALTIDWAWDFDANGAGTNDEKDTKLGNLPTLPTIAFDCEITIVQVD